MFKDVGKRLPRKFSRGGGRHKVINVNKIMNTCCTAIVLFDMDVAIYSLYEHI
jgi:hypothetical protein